jgi:hypothetical protein
MGMLWRQQWELIVFDDYDTWDSNGRDVHRDHQRGSRRIKRPLD